MEERCHAAALISPLSRFCHPAISSTEPGRKSPDIDVNNGGFLRGKQFPEIAEIIGRLGKHPCYLTPLAPMEAHVAILIRNPVVMKLARDLAALTGESEVVTIHRALEERAARMSQSSVLKTRRAEFARILGRESHRMTRAGRAGKSLTSEEVQELLAYGP